MSEKPESTREDPPAAAAVASVEVVRWTAGTGVVHAADELAVEEPLEIRVRGRAVAVTMRTPGHDAELAAGFLVAEGVIRSAGEIVRIERCAHPNAGEVLNVFLSGEVDFNRLTRHVFASSSCGVCGKATIDSVLGAFPKVGGGVTVRAGVLRGMPEALRGAQATFERTGGLHGAAVFDLDGRMIVAREDVGRHNAVDKVLGYGVLNHVDYSRCVLMVSGRTSFEIMQKAVASGVPVVAGISAPSSLAVQFAREAGQVLVGFLRGDRMNVYAGADRVAFG